MARTGVLIASAVLLAGAAGGVLVWTGVLKAPSGTSPLAITQSAEDRLVQQMSEAAASGGGYAVTFSQVEAAKWRVAPGHRLERFSVDGGQAVFARLISAAPLDKKTFEWPTQGLSVELPIEFNNRANGKQIEIGIVARSQMGRPPAPMYVVYATRQAGNSGWQEVALGADFEMKTLKYKMPAYEPGFTNKPVLVINADPSGGGGGVELLGIYVKIAADAGEQPSNGP